MSSRARRRVAVVATWYPSAIRPGLGSFVREHARALATISDVVVLYPDADEGAPAFPWSIADGVEGDLRTIRLHVYRPELRGARVALQIGAMKAALRRLRRAGWVPDVLHAHVQPAGLLALAARRRGTPVVVTEHYSGFARGAVTGLDLRLARLTFHRADLVCPVSENLAGHLRALGVERRMVTVPNAVDTDRFRPRSAAREPGPVRALLVAGLTAVKRVDLLLEALAHARARIAGPSITLTVVGDGPLLPELRIRCDALGLGADVRWLGRCDGDRVAGLMRESDFLVLPSDWENLPVVLLEAMASGLPVLATRVGGVAEIVAPDTGILVPPGDATALADALVDMAGRIDSFSPEGLHRRAVERYGFRAVAARWGELYDDLTVAGR